MDRENEIEALLLLAVQELLPSPYYFIPPYVKRNWSRMSECMFQGNSQPLLQARLDENGILPPSLPLQNMKLTCDCV